MALIKINPRHVHAVGHLISLSHSVRGNRGGGQGVPHCLFLCVERWLLVSSVSFRIILVEEKCKV